MDLISLSGIFNICSLILNEMITLPLNQISVIPQGKAMVLELFSAHEANIYASYI